MDPNLAQAAMLGNKDFLIQAFDACQKSHNSDYSCCFLSQHTPKKSKKDEAGNIFHLSARNGKDDFFREAIRILPDPIVHSLFTQPVGKSRWNPLHVAAQVGYLGIVKLILGFYGLGKSDQAQVQVFEPKPWLALDSTHKTPVHVALHNGKDDCAFEILCLVMELELKVLCNMVDKDGNSLLILAMKEKCNQVALHILKYAPSYSLSAKYGSTPLHFVTSCTEEVLRLLLKKHPNLIEAVDDKVIRKWTGTGKLWPLEYLLKTIAPESSKRHLIDLIYHTNNRGNNVFHVAAKGRKFEAAKVLANVYREERAKESGLTSSLQHMQVPWLVTNNELKTPLGLVMTKTNNKAYDEYCKLREEMDMEPVIHGKSELLFLAIEKKLYHAAMEIWDIQHKYGWSLYPSQGWEIWDAALKFSEEVAIWVTERLLSSRSNPDEVVIHTLPLVSEAGATKVVEWMLKNKSNALELAPEAWVKACERGHFSTIMAFIEYCRNFKKICLEKKDTPLHHIQFEGYKQYKDILENPVISGLKNFQNSNGETPLQKAIRKPNLLLTKALLTTDGVIRSIKDKEHKTAMDLLIKACESWEWDEMCKSIGIVPGLKMTYFQDKTNLLEVRNTLSVVAALLATITFTAGFTLPGGVKSDSTGKATLATNAAFLVFLIADALAMCSSMLVLVCLIWSMVCEDYKSLLLIDRSVLVLMLALCSTLVAFMTGVYVVIPHKSLWASIVILVMCSVSIILSERRIMDKLLNKLYPVLNRKHKDDVEQGQASTLSSEGHERSTHGSVETPVTA